MVFYLGRGFGKRLNSQDTVVIISMAKGDIIFCFFVFSVFSGLFAGWLWLQESGQQEPATLPSWKEWLWENELSSVRVNFKENGELYQN